MKKTIKMASAIIMAAAMAMSLASCGSSGIQVGGSAAPAETQKAEAQAQDAAAEAQAPAEFESGNSSLKGQNVRVVIGSTSTSGDSYMMADIVTRYLSKEMGFNGKVDAIGNASALDTVTTTKGDGKTLMMTHDIVYLSVLFGSVEDKYALENMTVGPRIGRNPGGCFGAAKESPYASLSEVTEYLKANPDATVSFNIESGGTSHIAFAAYYLHVKETEGEDVAKRIKAIVGGTTAEKLQRLWDRNADVIYGDTSAFKQYTEDGVEAQLAMNMFDSSSTVTGVEIKSMADDGIQFNGEPFDFPKDFAMYFPKDIDAGVLAEYEAAMKRVCENPDFQAEMEKLYYTPLSADEVGLTESNDFIYNKREITSKIVAEAPSLDEITG